MTKDWKRSIVSDQCSIKEAVHILNEGALQIGLIVDRDSKLVGVLTDGDFRRAMLAGSSMDAPVIEIMNREPLVTRLGDPKDRAFQLMRTKGINHVPVVDEEGRIHNVYTLNLANEKRVFPNEVILMAGGLGTRLKELTDTCPKPLLKVGERPLIETSILRFKDQGFENFTLCVNYLSEQLKSYFGGGERLGVKVSYTEEKKRMGTAGALRLIESRPAHDTIVMNGDILTSLDFSQLLQFHSSENNMATMAVRRFESRIPYGVLQLEGTEVIAMKEKPVQSYFINAGIYCFNPRIFDLIPNDEYFDMNQFFNLLLEKEIKVGAYPISDYWIDIGHIEDYEKANIEFPFHFK